MEPPTTASSGLFKPLKGKPTPGPVTLVIVNRLDKKVTLNGILQHMGRGINLSKPVQIVLEPGATMRPVFQLDDTRLLDQHSHWKLALAGEGLPSGKVMSGMLQKTGRTIEITHSALGMQKPSKHPDKEKHPRKPIPDEDEWRKDPRKRPDGDRDPRKPIPDEDEWGKDPRKRPDGDRDPRKPIPDEDEWRKDPRKRPDGDRDPRKPIPDEDEWRKDPRKRPDDGKQPPTPGDLGELRGRPTPGPVTVIIVNRLDKKIVVNCSLKHKARGMNLAKPIQIVLEPGKTLRPSFQLDDTRLVDEHAQWIFSIAGEGVPAGKSMNGMIQKSGRTIEITPEALGMKPLRKKR